MPLRQPHQTNKSMPEMCSFCWWTDPASCASEYLKLGERLFKKLDKSIFGFGGVWVSWKFYIFYIRIFFIKELAFKRDIKTKQQFPEEVMSGFSKHYPPFTNFNISGQLLETLICSIHLKPQNRRTWAQMYCSRDSDMHGMEESFELEIKLVPLTKL